MAKLRNANDPNRTDDEMRTAASFDSELQPDSELAEGPASGGRIALLAVAIAVVLGLVFYGLNNTSTGTNTAQTPPANQSTAQQTSPPPVPPGVRDVTPHSNTQPGVTTGATPAQPQQPAAALNRSANPPANNPPAAR
jgi:uncharacterized protein HemX